MRTLLLTCLIAAAGLIFGCEPTQKEPHSPIVVPPLAAKTPPPPAPTVAGEAPAQAPDYQHRIEKSPIEEPKIGEGRTLKWRIAVARFGDMRKAIGSPFRPGSEVTIAGRTIVVKSADVEPCPAFTEMLIQKLIDAGRFIVVERKDINKVLLEQEFGLEGRVQPRTAAAVRKVLGVELIITGEVGTVKVKAADNTTIDQTSVMLRIYDVSTAEILGSATVTGDNLQAAVDQATAKVVASIKDRPWLTKISRITAEKIFLNAGDVDGVHPGDQFKIFSVKAEIRDPDEGTVLGRDTTEAGRIEITAVFEKYSEARIMKAAVPFRVGDLAEFVPGPYAQHDMGRPGGGL
jgi:hypothetical protein